MFALVHFARGYTEGDYRYIEINDSGYEVTASLLPPNRPTTARNDRIRGNIDLGHELALLNGYSEQDWQCLYNLGMNESGWSDVVVNTSSGAFGIPQALPASKISGNRTDPAVQIKWMISYISSRYHSPCNAYKFQVNNNWY